MDESSIVSKPRDIGSRVDAGKQGISHIQFSRENYTHVILFVVARLQGIILKWGYVRYGIVSAFECDGRWSTPTFAPVELARGTVPGQIHIANIDNNVLTQKTDIGKLIPVCVGDLDGSGVCCPIGKNPVICR